MDIKTEKSLKLFKLWLLLNYPELRVEPLFKEYEEDYVEFKEFVDEFICSVIL